MSNSKLIAVTGGIGTGKSMVSEALRVMGYQVYDCDTEAKQLMDCDPEIHHAIARKISPEAICNGKIDRECLARHVFSDAAKLQALNSITHARVKAHLSAWAAHRKGIKFVETAILNTSGLWQMVDEAWLVEAPVDVRISRVMARNGISAQQVEARIAAQAADAVPLTSPTRLLINDNLTPLLPQIEHLLHSL